MDPPPPSDNNSNNNNYNNIPHLNHAEETALDRSFAELVSEVHIPAVNFSPKEQQILDLWAELQEQRVENALLEAQVKLEKGERFLFIVSC